MESAEQIYLEARQKASTISTQELADMVVRLAAAVVSLENQLRRLVDSDEK